MPEIVKGSAETFIGNVDDACK